MSKISSKAWMIIGLISEGPGFSVLISLIFPDISADASMSIFMITLCLGVIAFTLSLAKKRIEGGKVQTKKPLGALTSAQVVLDLSMILQIIVMVTYAFGIKALEWLSVFTFFGLIASIILAIVGAKKHCPKENCERCGAAADKGTLKRINGQIFCDPCAEIMKADEKSAFLKLKAQCNICRKEFDKDKMILVDDQLFCNSCFCACYDDSASADNVFEG